MSTIPDVPRSHEENAQAIIAQLRAMAATVPGYGYLTTERRRRLIATANLPDDLLQAAGYACDGSEQLTLTSELTGADVRDTVAYTAAYQAVVKELDHMSRGVRDAITTRRSSVGLRVLRAYALAQRINRPEERELLIPHVAAMKRAMLRFRPGSGGRITDPLPQPEPDAPSPAAAAPKEGGKS